ncbi:hypothetical protein CK203_057781 [Vitis vinifera]|uniref:Uncharacterized protein n=1 Tax=Vitis vinifera TaxID=29760 RepID=A0A438CV34_VITVI|nr:hypothetical protein CK203_096726 [Vitis vinifera]RVW73157.1 hypothetical protein CK203_057781 [Vitis vinifera]
MGGVDHGHGEDFRTKVWSMTGGPNCRPKHWKRNTAIAMFGVFLICIPIAMKSAELEVSLFHSLLLAVNQFIIVIDFESLGVPTKKCFILQQRPHHPVRPIPSQLWCKNFGNKEY